MKTELFLYLKNKESDIVSNPLMYEKGVSSILYLKKKGSDIASNPLI